MPWISSDSTEPKPLKSALKSGRIYNEQHTGASAPPTKPIRSVQISSADQLGERDSARSVEQRWPDLTLDRREGGDSDNPTLLTRQPRDTMDTASRSTNPRFTNNPNPAYSYNGGYGGMSGQSGANSMIPYSQPMSTWGNPCVPYQQMDNSWNSGPTYNSGQQPGWYNMASMHNTGERLYSTPYPQAADPSLSMAQYPHPADTIIGAAWVKSFLAGETPTEADTDIIEDYLFDTRKGTKLTRLQRVGLALGIEPSVTVDQIDDEIAEQVSHFAETLNTAYKSVAAGIGGTSTIGMRDTESDMIIQPGSMPTKRRSMRHMATQPSQILSPQSGGDTLPNGARSAARPPRQVRVDSIRMNSLSRLLPPPSLPTDQYHHAKSVEGVLYPFVYPTVTFTFLDLRGNASSSLNPQSVYKVNSHFLKNPSLSCIPLFVLEFWFSALIIPCPDPCFVTHTATFVFLRPMHGTMNLLLSL